MTCEHCKGTGVLTVMITDTTEEMELGIYKIECMHCNGNGDGEDDLWCCDECHETYH